MKKSLVFICLSALTFALVGCQQDNSNKVNNEQVAVEKNKAPVPLKSTQSQVEKLNKEKIQKLPSIKKMAENRTSTYMINGEKFTTKTENFWQGEKVYNLAINQLGTIKGSIVIIVDKEASLSDEIKSLGEVSKIAQDTYRIKLPAKINVLSIYHKVTKMKFISRTEMEVDYTPESNREVM